MASTSEDKTAQRSLGLEYIWGTSLVEREVSYPCDTILAGADAAMWRAVSVAAPVSVVFRWLCQLRVAPYSYDLIDNFGRRSPQTLTAGLEQLAVGQTVMTIFEIAEFSPDQHLTIRMKDSLILSAFGTAAMSYVVLPIDNHTTRLIGKLGLRYPPGLLGWLLRHIIPWSDFIMMRRQLLNMQQLAERDVHLLGDHTEGMAS